MIIKGLISVDDALNMGSYLDYFHSIGDIELDDLSTDELIELVLTLRSKQTDNVDIFSITNTKVIHKIISHINRKYLNTKTEKNNNPVLMEGKHQFKLTVLLNKKHIECLKKYNEKININDIQNLDSFFELCQMGFYFENSVDDNIYFLPTLMYKQFITNYVTD